MNYEQNEQIRRAAILVASLDEALAEQMLESLPRSEALKILAEVDRLDEIDPDEQRDVLDEFRRAGKREKEPIGNGVEFTYSAPQLPPIVETAPVVEPPVAEIDEAAATAEAALIAELLGLEHPQTVAVALSRMPQDQGAAVFACMPAAIQEEVFGRLANLQITDESAAVEVEVELQQRIELRRQHRERAAAGAEMARRMVAKTAPGQRETLLARISPKEIGSSAGLLLNVHSTAMATLSVAQARQLEAAIQEARELVAAEDQWLESEEASFEAWTDESEVGRDVVEFDPALLEDRSRDLERLSDAALLRALQTADERTVQLALACSSERFLRRVAAKLPRPAAARLRMAVRSIGPTRLADLRSAQHELVHLAEASTSQAVA